MLLIECPPLERVVFNKLCYTRYKTIFHYCSPANKTIPLIYVSPMHTVKPQQTKWDMFNEEMTGSD